MLPVILIEESSWCTSLNTCYYLYNVCLCCSWNTMVLEFIPPICLGAPIENYKLQWCLQGDPDSVWQEQLVEPPKTSATITGVRCPLKYEVTVAAISAGGQGAKGCSVESPPPSEPSACVLYGMDASYDRVSSCMHVCVCVLSEYACR